MSAHSLFNARLNKLPDSLLLILCDCRPGPVSVSVLPPAVADAAGRRLREELDEIARQLSKERIPRGVVVVLRNTPVGTPQVSLQTSMEHRPDRECVYPLRWYPKNVQESPLAIA